MKLSCGPTRDYLEKVEWPSKFTELENFIREQNKHPKWSPWFAWYPVRISETECRWLEFVERTPDYGIDCDWFYFSNSLSGKMINNEPKLEVRGYFYRATKK